MIRKTTKQHNLKAKSDAELHAWITGHQPISIEYISGIQELMRRNEAPVRKREWIVLGIAFLSLAIAIIAIIATYE